MSISALYQSYLRDWRPRMVAAWTRVVYTSHNVRIGDGFRADGLPRMLVDPGASLEIGDGVEFRSGVEIRVHGTARVRIGAGVRIDRGVRILAANSAAVSIGDRARIGLYAVMNGGDSITVGASALVSGFVYLQTSTHAHESTDKPIRDQGFTHGPVTIGEGAWLAAHVVVMPGITVGEGAIVGSNAVVTRDVAARHVVAGIPATTLRIRE